MSAVEIIASAVKSKDGQVIYQEGLQLELHDSIPGNYYTEYQWVKLDPHSSTRYVRHAVWGLIGVPTLPSGFKNSTSQESVALSADPGC